MLSRLLARVEIGGQMKPFILLKDIVNTREFQQQVTFELKDYEHKLPSSELSAYPQLIDFVFQLEQDFPKEFPKSTEI